eukprot:2152019-Karenia_brevis.AAC.1
MEWGDEMKCQGTQLIQKIRGRGDDIHDLARRVEGALAGGEAALRNFCGGTGGSGGWVNERRLVMVVRKEGAKVGKEVGEEKVEVETVDGLVRKAVAKEGGRV